MSFVRNSEKKENLQFAPEFYELIQPGKHEFSRIEQSRYKFAVLPFSFVPNFLPELCMQF